MQKQFSWNVVNIGIFRITESIWLPIASSVNVLTRWTTNTTTKKKNAEQSGEKWRRLIKFLKIIVWKIRAVSQTNPLKIQNPQVSGPEETECWMSSIIPMNPMDTRRT